MVRRSAGFPLVNLYAASTLACWRKKARGDLIPSLVSKASASIHSAVHFLMSAAVTLAHTSRDSITSMHTRLPSVSSIAPWSVKPFCIADFSVNQCTNFGILFLCLHAL